MPSVLRTLLTVVALGVAPTAVSQTENVVPPKAPEDKAQLEAAKKELLALEEKAKQGDLKAALELADNLVTYGNAQVATPFYRQAAQGGVLTAQEKLGLILLNTADRATWAEGHGWLDKAAQKGSVRALEEQARMILFGSHGLEKSVKRSQELLEKARVMPGAKESHYLLGKMAAEGIGRVRDGAVAVDHLRRGEGAGSVDAMLGLAELFATDVLVKKNLAEAERLARKAFALGSAEAAYRLALMFEGDDPKIARFTDSAEWLQKAAERGHTGAMARLGTYALQGLGEEKNAKKAYQRYREAAARGHADAAYAIANLYDQGAGVPQDPVAAAGWYRIAAEGGQAQAQNEYGVRLAAGRGIPADLAQAATWFTRACQQNLSAAFVNLGELFLLGNGVAKDEERAHNLFESAAKSNHAGAQVRLANLCEKGIGLGGRPDAVGAAYWAARAAAHGKAYEEQALRLRKALQPAQAGELDRRLAAVKKQSEPK